MYSYGPPHMAWQKQDDQLEHTFSSYVRIRDVVLKTCQRRWTIGRSGERVRDIRASGTTWWCWWYDTHWHFKVWVSCHHHHHIALVARISLTLSYHSSLSFIALGRSSGPVSSYSCWMYVRAGRPAFARPCVGVHKSTYLRSSSLLLQQCPACLVRLT